MDHIISEENKFVGLEVDSLTLVNSNHIEIYNLELIDCKIKNLFICSDTNPLKMDLDSDIENLYMDADRFSLFNSEIKCSYSLYEKNQDTFCTCDDLSFYIFRDQDISIKDQDIFLFIKNPVTLNLGEYNNVHIHSEEKIVLNIEKCKKLIIKGKGFDNIIGKIKDIEYTPSFEDIKKSLRSKVTLMTSNINIELRNYPNLKSAYLNGFVSEFPNKIEKIYLENLILNNLLLESLVSLDYVRITTSKIRSMTMRDLPSLELINLDAQIKYISFPSYFNLGITSNFLNNVEKTSGLEYLDMLHHEIDECGNSNMFDFCKKHKIALIEKTTLTKSL